MSPSHEDESANGSHAAGVEQLGRLGVVPFRFACHRCARCCTGGQGYVWVTPDEIERMAEHLGVSRQSFSERFVRAVSDPLTDAPGALGALRLSLVESGEGEGGRCALLAGANTCSVHAARPQHCRLFPYWPRGVEEAAAFENARATCPGIAVEVSDAIRESTFSRLAALHEKVDAFVESFSERSHEACRSQRASHERCCLASSLAETVFATALEADFAVHRMKPSDLAARRCSHDARPISCRLAALPERDGEAGAMYFEELRAIERATGYPTGYGRFADMLMSRVSGWPAAQASRDEPSLPFHDDSESDGERSASKMLPGGERGE